MSTAPGFFQIRFLAIMLVITSCHHASAQTSNSPGAESYHSGKHSFESRFWNYLVANNYKNWAPPAGQDGDFFDGTGPHGALLKLYLNRTAITDTESLDNESVIVMEDYRADKTLKSISVMLKSENSNPEVDDWFWVVYRPDGSVIESSERVPTAMDRKYARSKGKKQSPFQKVSRTTASTETQTCVQCHRQAPGDDFVFFNRAEGHRVATDDQSIQLEDVLTVDTTR